MSDISFTQKLDSESVSYAARCIAERLVKIHGSGHFSREAGGLHLNIPSPKALALYGTAELHKRHLAVNLDKYLGEGKYEGEPDERCTRCMKTGTWYRVSELLEMPPLSERGLNITDTSAEVKPIVNKNYLINDGHGNMVPLPPGDTTPLNQLPSDHPAIWYVKDRGFDPTWLTEYLGASYCYREYPEGGERRIFYPKMAFGFKDTPQGRIVFRITRGGVDQGWQARILDYVEDATGYYYVLHPYANTWTPVKHKTTDGSWEYCTGFSSANFKISKYRTGFGVRRRSVLMGLDAAVSWNQGRTEKAVVLLEGPLDVARWGPPAVGLLGKYLSADQAHIISRLFAHGRVLIPADHDASGTALVEKVTEMLGPRGLSIETVEFPKSVKDIGALNSFQVSVLKRQYNVE